MYNVAFVDKKTEVVLDEVARPTFSHAMMCASVNETDEIDCFISDEIDDENSSIEQSFSLKNDN